MATYIRLLRKLEFFMPFQCNIRHSNVSDASLRKRHMCNSVQQDPVTRHHLLASICIERKPVITKELTPLEAEVSKVLSQIEYENSLLNDHELRHLEDMRRKKRLLEGNATELDLEASAIQTAHDFEDLANEEFQKFQSASRITEADELNDQKSLNRRLEEHLLLLIKCKREGFLSGAFGEWQLPFAKHELGETLRQTAERAVKEQLGQELTLNVFGNAPIGFYKLKYPKKYKKDGIEGAKVFFFRGHYVKGGVISNTIEDHRWVTRDEMDEILSSNPSYKKAIKSFTYDDRFTYQPTNELVTESIRSVLEGSN